MRVMAASKAFLPQDPQESAPAGSSERLWALFDTAAARWPTLAVEPVRFFGHLGRCSGHDLQRAERLHVEDLWLVLAVVDELPGALAEFESAIWPAVRRQLRRRAVAGPSPWRIDASKLDEVIQRLRTYALVHETGAEPRILSYVGRAALPSWMLVGAVRTLNRLYRDASRVDSIALESKDPALVAALDVEDLLLRVEAKELLDEALRRASADLDHDDRSLLRLHVRDGLAIDQIATLHGIHRATAARRLERARRHFARSTRRHLALASALPPWEIESMIRLVRSSFGSLIKTYLTSRPRPALIPAAPEDDQVH